MSHIALYHQMESSSAVAVLQGIHQLLLVFDPPRFYILLLLVSVSLVILVKAGFFDGEAGHSVDVYVSGNGPNLGVAPAPAGGIGDPHDGAYPVAVSIKSDAEEFESGIDIVEEELRVEEKPDNSDKEASPCMISQEPNMIKYEESAMEGEESDVEELHKRVEAYICKVRMRLSRETTA